LGESTFLDDEFGLTGKQLLLVNAVHEQGKKTGAGGNKVRPERGARSSVGLRRGCMRGART
jgi:hypothetical protein